MRSLLNPDEIAELVVASALSSRDELCVIDEPTFDFSDEEFQSVLNEGTSVAIALGKGDNALFFSARGFTHWVTVVTSGLRRNLVVWLHRCDHCATVHALP